VNRRKRGQGIPLDDARGALEEGCLFIGDEKQERRSQQRITKYYDRVGLIKVPSSRKKIAKLRKDQGGEKKTLFEAKFGVGQRVRETLYGGGYCSGGVNARVARLTLRPRETKTGVVSGLPLG